MSFGKMNTFIDLVKKEVSVDAEGFKSEKEVTLASVRAYREEGTEARDGRTWLLFRKLPTCSASGSFPVYPRPQTLRSSAMATDSRSPRWRM